MITQSDFLVNIDLISVVDTDAHTDFLCKEIILSKGDHRFQKKSNLDHFDKLLAYV